MDFSLKVVPEHLISDIMFLAQFENDEEIGKSEFLLMFEKPKAAVLKVIIVKKISLCFSKRPLEIH